MKKPANISLEIEHFTSLDHIWWGAKTIAGQKRYDNKAALFQKLCTRRGRILEVGCGDGEFTKRLAKLGNKIVATDATPALIKRARKNIKTKNVTFRVCDAGKLKFIGGSFNI